MSEINRKNCNNRIRLIGLLLVCAAVLIFMSRNAFLYKETVVKIVKEKTEFAYEEYGPNEEVEKYYTQQMTAVVLNGQRKGQEIHLDNTYSFSGIDSERYKKGQQLFVSLSENADEGTIIGRKRDVYLVYLICVLCFLLFYLNGRHGVVIACSLIVNILAFVIALQRYGQGEDLVKLAFWLMMIFCVITLMLASGFRKKTFVAILSTIVTTFLCYGIYEIVLQTNKRLSYEMLDYVVNSADLPELFVTGVLMGSLGAVMDVSISIVAGVDEIIKQTPDIDMKALINSVREMGYDIMGTMINVLFFTYISGGMSIVIIKIMNGYTLYHLVNFQLVFEIIRFLVGAIGIVLAIPVSGLFAVLFMYKMNK